MKPRIAIVGCGHIAKTHAKNLQGQAELVFSGRSPQKSRLYAANFGGDAFEGSFEDLLSESKIEALVLCTPPEIHFEQTIACIRAQKSVLVEKPLVRSPEELEQLEKALEAFSSVFMVAENYYYKPSFMRIRQMLKQGHIGDLRRIRLQKLSLQKPQDWKTKYGALVEGGIHFVALMNGLAESKPLKLRAEIPESEEIERSSRLSVEYENSVVAELAYAWNHPALLKGLFQKSSLEGSTGQINFESNGIYMSLTSYRTGIPAYMPFLKDIAGYSGMMKNFLNALQQKEEVYSNFSRAKRDLQLIFDAYKINGRDAVGRRIA